jgi:uncharacterized protein
MLIGDTAPLVAYLNRSDRDHERCATLLDSRTDDLLISPYVATEACYLIGKYIGAKAEINLVEALATGDLNQIDVPVGDLIRMAELMREYMGFPLGVTDASVIAAAERPRATEVATLDQRHFRAITPAPRHGAEAASMTAGSDGTIWPAIRCWRLGR